MPDDGSAFYMSRLDRLFDGGVNLLSRIASQSAMWLLAANAGGLFFVLLPSPHFPGAMAYSLFLLGLVVALISLGWSTAAGMRVTGQLAQLASDLRQTDEVRQIRMELNVAGIAETPGIDNLDRAAAERTRQFYTDVRRKWRIMIGPHVCNLMSALIFIAGLAIPLLTGAFEPLEDPAPRRAG